MRLLTYSLVVAMSAPVGLIAACARESSVTVNQAGAVAPASESGVSQAATSAGSSSPEIGWPTPSVSVPVPPELEASLEETPLVPRAPAPAVAPSAELSGGRVSTLLDADPPELRPQPQILHVEVDGDNAVIISGQAAQAPQRGEEGSGLPPPSKGEKFIWHDGDREASVWQDTRLVVGDVISGGGWGDPYGPVFWSQSDNLMALPGGVVLMLDATWDTDSVEAFMRSNNIDSSDLKAFEGLINSFEVETDPGFPSLRLANALAGQGGVIVSSPNWWIDESVR